MSNNSFEHIRALVLIVAMCCHFNKQLRTAEIEKWRSCKKILLDNLSDEIIILELNSNEYHSIHKELTNVFNVNNSKEAIKQLLQFLYTPEPLDGKKLSTISTILNDFLINPSRF